MTNTSFGQHFGTFKASVVNRTDPIKGGRLQIRVFGEHDDKINIPDEHLPWAYMEQTVTSASLNHIGSSPTGAMVGSTVSGYWADKDHTIPMINGTIPRTQVDKPSGNQQSQTKSADGQSDVAPNARGVQKTGAPNETNMGKDIVTALGKSIIEKAMDGSGDPAVAFQKMLSGALKTVGSIPFAEAQKLLNIIKTVDPSNASGAIAGAVAGMTALKNITAMGSALASNGQIPGIVLDLAKQVASGQANTAINSITAMVSNPGSVSVSSTPSVNASSVVNPAVLSAAHTIISQIEKTILSNSDIVGGLGSFDKLQGVMTSMEKEVQKMFK